jgi:cytochrome c oxidase cbb3-type subunit 2
MKVGPLKNFIFIILNKPFKISIFVMPHLIFFLFTLCFLSESGYSADLKSADNNKGKAVYERYCEGCHGVNGDGDGEYARSMNPKPRDFTSGIFKWTSRPAGSIPTDRDLMITISEGIHGTSMPPWGALKESDRRQVISFIKTFSNRFKKIPSDLETFIYPPPPKTPELIQEGKLIYQRTGCDRCHGMTGKGDGFSAHTLMDDWDNPILPTDFYHGIIKTGSEDWKIYRTIANGLGGTPMPSSVNQLEPNEIWAMVYFIRSLKH